MQDILIKVSHQTLQSVDHIVNFDAVDELGIVAQLRLDPIELGVEFLKVGEGAQVHSLHVVSDVLVGEKEFDNFVAKHDLLQIRCGLFEPLFQ